MKFSSSGDFTVYSFNDYLNDDGFYVFSFNDELVKLTEDELRDELCELMFIAHNYDRLLACSPTREDALIKSAILEVILKANESLAKKKERELKRKTKNKLKIKKKSRKNNRR